MCAHKRCGVGCTLLAMFYVMLTAGTAATPQSLTYPETADPKAHDVSDVRQEHEICILRRLRDKPGSNGAQCACSVANVWLVA